MENSNPQYIPGGTPGVFNVHMTGAEFSVVPGSSVEIPLVVQNNSSTPEIYDISARGVPVEWVRVSAPSLLVGGGEKKQVTIVIHPPSPPISQWGEFELIITVSPRSNPVNTKESKTVLRVAAYQVLGRLGVLVESIQFSVQKGNSVDVPLVIINYDLTAENFFVSAEGIPAEWVKLATPVVRLEPRARKELRLVITPGATPQNRAGRHPFRIRVAAQSTPNQAVEVNCLLTVAAFSDFKVEMVPQRLGAGVTGRVAVGNTGNITSNFLLTWSSENDNLEFESAPLLATPVSAYLGGQAVQPPGMNFIATRTQTLHIEPGGVKWVEYRAKPRQRPWVGGEKAYPFSLSITSSEKATKTVNGDVIGGGLLPLGAVLALGGLAVIGVILILSVLLFTLPGRVNEGRATSINAEVQTQQFNIFQATSGKQTAIYYETFDAQLETKTQAQADTEAALSATATFTPVVTSTITQAPTPTEVIVVAPSTTFTPSDTRTPTSTRTITSTPTVTDTPTETPIPIVAGVLLIETNRDGNPEIYSIRGSDREATRLTISTGKDTQPAWSPDGSRIAFTSNRDGNNEVYILNSDGTGLVNLTNNAADDQNPSWSPDGKNIAFTTNRDGNNEIYVMNADGTSPINISNNAAGDSQPAWFSGGIVFTSNRDGNAEIYLMQADGSGPTNLTKSSSSNDHDAAPSPDGKTIAYTTNKDGNQEIYTMKLDGSKKTNLTKNSYDDFTPRWNPTGAYIAFTTDRSGHDQVYIMKNNGTKLFNFNVDDSSDLVYSWN